MAVRQVLGTATASALVIGVLSGCSAEEPANETLPSTSAETSASEDALPPLGPPDFPVPDEARQKTPEGALEFTRYYIGLGTHIASGSVAPEVLIELSDGCALCREVALSYRNDLSVGLTYRGFEYAFEAYGPPLIRENTAEIGFVYSQSDYELIDPRGNVLPDRSVAATGNLQSGASLEWREQIVGWVVTSLTIG